MLLHDYGWIKINLGDGNNNNNTQHVGIHGIEYWPGCVLRLQEMDELLGNDYAVYGQVDEIIVWEDEKFFILT